MATITLPTVIVSVPPELTGEASLERIREGLQNAVMDRERAETEPIDQFRYEGLEDYDDAVLDYEREVIDSAAAEIAPQVAELMVDAIRRRLPWTGEGRGVRGKAEPAGLGAP